MALNDPNILPFTEIENIALALSLFDDGGQHCGLIYRIDDDEPKYVHLAWHFQLRHEEPQKECFWLHPAAFTLEEKRLIALLVRRIGQWREQIPYGLSHVGVQFDEQGHLTGLRPGQGLTCATFVLAVFASLGYELVTEASWPLDANAEWQQWVVAQLEKPASLATEAHVAAVRSQIGGRRINPSEVVAAGSQIQLPVAFPNAAAAAEELLAEAARLKAARAA